MADWLVNIVEEVNGQAKFVVGLPGCQQGQPLQADQDDLVSWYNQTNDSHQIWQTDSDYNPLGQSALPGLVKPGQPSNTYDCAQPAWLPASWTIYYYCSLHPHNELERGSIQVAALPQRTINITGAGASAAFSPASLGAQSAWPINWYNATNDQHQPWQTDQNYNPLPQSSLAAVIAPQTSSLVYTLNPPGNPPVSSWTVYYYCKLHPNAKNERGTIVIPPPSS
jgi:hypothetical protein